MKKQFIFLVAAVSLLSAGCSTVGPVGGFLYADVSGPVAATSNPRGPNHGEACAKSFFGFVGLGDASITAAMKAGGIGQISHVEQHSTNIIGFTTYCTQVYGFPPRTAAPAGK